jgi:hypothetical protein
MWIIFGGTEDSPVITRFVHNKSDLDSIRLEDNEWVEEFEVEEKKNDRKICPPAYKRHLE